MTMDRVTEDTIGLPLFKAQGSDTLITSSHADRHHHRNPSTSRPPSLLSPTRLSRALESALASPIQHNYSPAAMDTLSKETLGLPVFISAASGSTITSSEADMLSHAASCQAQAQTQGSGNSSGSGSKSRVGSVVALSRPTSLLSPLATKRFSQALDFALAKFDELCESAQTLLMEDGGATTGSGPRLDDLESGGLAAGADWRTAEWRDGKKA